MKLLQWSAKYFLDLAEFFWRPANVIFFLHRVTNLEVIDVVNVEISINLTIFALGHYACK